MKKSEFEQLIEKLEKGNYEIDQPAGPAKPYSPGDVLRIPGGSMGRGRRSQEIQGIVVHHTSGETLEGAIEHGRKTGTGATYYVVADPKDPNNAKVYLGAAEEEVTAHIRSPGSPYRAGGRQLPLSSQNTVGIEVVAPNDKATHTILAHHYSAVGDAPRAEHHRRRAQ